MNLAILCVLISCSGAVDRTPPRQDVGLPLAPSLPDELLRFDGGKPLVLSDLSLNVPDGCTLKPSKAVDRQVFDCLSRVELIMPKAWKRVGDLSIWTKNDRSIAHTWVKRGDRWSLIRSVHQSKGDHASEDVSSGMESSTTPQ